MRNFETAKELGENAERMLWAWLRGKYGKALKHISEYHEPASRGIYRDDENNPMPDFLVKQKGKKPIFIESKMKVGWKGCLNINVNQVKSYLKVAKKNNADFILYFLCTSDRKLYKLTAEDLRNKARTNWDKQQTPFFTYEKENLEVVFDDVPQAIFNTDKLYVK